MDANYQAAVGLQRITSIPSRRRGVRENSWPTARHGNELVAFGEVRHGTVELSRAPFSREILGGIGNRLIDIDDVHTLAQGIVDTIRDPLLVLDQHLRVVTANRAFCQTFRITRENIEDRAVYALADGQWDIPALRFLLENIAPHHTVMEGYEVEREFPGIGRRSMLLNAREVVSQSNARKLILLTIEDVTERRAVEREAAELLRQKELLLQEMQHRIANSLQIVASILLLKARTVQSETRGCTLGTRIGESCSGCGPTTAAGLKPWRSGLHRPLSLSIVQGPCSFDDGRQSSNLIGGPGGRRHGLVPEAVSIGLIVTELVINAFKHAFVGDEGAGLVVVGYEAAETSWRLTVSDNGIGAPEGQLNSDKPRAELGTIVVAALAKQLDARVEVMRGRRGTTVSIAHGTSDRAWLPLADVGIGLPSKSNGNSVAAA